MVKLPYQRLSFWQLPVRLNLAEREKTAIWGFVQTGSPTVKHQSHRRREVASEAQPKGERSAFVPALVRLWRNLMAKIAERAKLGDL
jgi:hypothetical protein